MIQIRKLTENDFPNVVRLLNETNRDSYEFIPFNETEIRSKIEERKLTTLVAEKSGQVLGTVTYGDGHWGEEIRWLAACGGPTQKMIEDTLVTNVEKYVKRGSVFVSVDSESPKMDDWVERGYSQDGGLYHMIARIEKGRPVPQVPEGFFPRSLKPEEEESLVKTVNDVFGFERLKVGFIEKTKSESPPFDEGCVHVAELEKRIVSAVVFLPASKYNNYYGASRAYFGPAATVVEHQGKGLASALTVRAINLVFEKGLNVATLYTSERNTSSVALLQNVGFKVGHRWKFMRNKLAAERKSS